jgi:hypothetical protein
MTFTIAAIIFAGLFLALLILLHFLKPELDPSWRMISEYEIGRYGWLMRIAFLCWGLSVLALALAIWPALITTGGAIGRVWLIVIGVFLFGAGIFKTDPITADTNSVVNTIHKVCGTVVILTFPIAATLAAHSLGQNPPWAVYRGALTAVTALVWVGMVVYFASVTRGRMKDPHAGEPGHPPVYMGWPNRFDIATYLLWLIVVAALAIRLG